MAPVPYVSINPSKKREVQVVLFYNNGMSNTSTEEIGVNYLKNLLSKTHVVVTSNILTGEKNVSWDGSLSVYNGEAGKKELFLGSIPVQIKTVHQDNNNNRFSIEKADLINYKKEGRIMYFYITLNKKEKETVFYLPLQLWDIETMLRDFGDQQSKTFTFKRFPKTTKDIINVLYDFIKENDAQKQLLPGIHSFRDLINQKGNVDVSFAISVPKNTSVFAIPKIIKEKQPYLKYKSKDTNLEYVVDRLVSTNFFLEVRNCVNVGFKDDCFFKNLTAKGDEESFVIECSKLLFIRIEMKRVIFNYNFAAGTLDEQIKLARFFEKLLNVHSFFINKNKIKMPDEQLELFEKKLKVHTDFLCRFDDFRTKLSLKATPDFKNASEKDFILFDMISTCVLDGQTINKLKDDNGLMIFDLFGLRLLLCVISSDKYSFIMNWADDKYIKLSCSTDPDETNLSPYFYLESQQTNWLLLADNIDIDLIESKVFDNNMTTFKCNCISNIVVNLIAFFDKKHDKHILDVASNISNRLLSIRPDDVISVLNDVQIHYRQNNVSLGQTQKIKEIIKANPDNYVIQFACFLLIGNKQKSDYYYKKLTNEEIEVLKKWPIYNLYDNNK